MVIIITIVSASYYYGASIGMLIMNLHPQGFYNIKECGPFLSSSLKGQLILSLGVDQTWINVFCIISYF